MIIVIMGVAGSGKSTIGMLLAERLGFSFLEGDTLHPASNLAKMSRGEPLDDNDRWLWLARIGQEMAQVAARSASLVVACSALAVRYRERLKSYVPELRWVFLQGSREVIAERLLQRQGHFMKSSMLESQFAVLEPPQLGEALEVDIECVPNEIVEKICQSLKTESDK
jgi:carbohydrate kinase (thermoresistant glucokinase family)